MSCAAGCPYEGNVDPVKVAHVSEFCQVVVLSYRETREEQKYIEMNREIILSTTFSQVISFFAKHFICNAFYLEYKRNSIKQTLVHYSKINPDLSVTSTFYLCISKSTCNCQRNLLNYILSYELNKTTSDSEICHTFRSPRHCMTWAAMRSHWAIRSGLLPQG